MENRFRIDGAELGVDTRRSVASLDADGVLEATAAAASVPAGVGEWATVPPRLLLSRIPLRFDGERFGATIDQALLDELLLDDGGVTFTLSSRFEALGTVTSLAGDRVRFVGAVETPWSAEPWRLDVSLGFGGQRRPAV